MATNVWAILVSAVAAMAVGAVWYSPAVFAKPWMKLTGRKDMNPGEGAVVGYVTAFIGALIMAYVLSKFLGYLATDHAVSASDGMVVGFLAWLGFTGPAFLTTYTFADRPRKLWAIDALQYLAVLVVMGAILGAWQK